MAYQLTLEEKGMVVSVAKFFEEEKDSKTCINVNNVVRRTAEACSGSESTVYRCGQAHVEEKSESEAPNAQPIHGRPVIVVDEFTVGAIRRIVHSFYCTGKHPTQSKVFARCQQEIVDLPKLGRTTFLKLLKSIGFRCCRSKCIP